jgi:hypothetical protein
LDQIQTNIYPYLPAATVGTTDPRAYLGLIAGQDFVFLEHVPKKLLDFFDSDMLQLFDFERVLIDQMVPFDRDAL